ncbi:MAG: DNA repair protein RadA [Candidatus Sericytochromatia bacterium]|nr:MAG: DNA repair protein RadA [Candidatus Sericytochromatia bacterium]
MSKNKISYICQECSAIFPKWSGKCLECGAWNSLVENEVITDKKNSSSFFVNSKKEKPIKIQDISFKSEDRILTDMSEFNRVLGGGIVPGSLVLLGGDPGIGKSTILLQISYYLSLKGKKIFYVTAEESLNQVKLRALRMGIDKSDNLFIISESDINYINKTILDIKPDICIIDSIQAIYDNTIDSVPGSVTQIKNNTQVLMKTSKENNISIFIIGHVTKEGIIAGPKIMEHMVDTVLYFEGEKYKSYRIIRAVKNRFGATNEVGIFEMIENGIKEVINPSKLFLSEYNGTNSGSCVIVSMEGSRPILVEVQALAYPTYTNMPRRSTIGYEYNRLNQIIAILEKRIGINLSKSDVFVNIVGGLKINEPSADLGVAIAIISSIRDIIIPQDTVAIGELGLGGELRNVSNIEQRLKEVYKLGFKKALIPSNSLPLSIKFDKFDIIGLKKLVDVLIYFGKDKK